MTTQSDPMPSVLFISNVDRAHPLLRSQGIPLINRLSKEGYRMGFLSIENLETLGSKEDKKVQDMLGDGVALYPVRMDKWMWLRGWVRKLFWGTLGTMKVQRRHRYQVLHARSFEPAVMAWMATLFYGGKWIYDTRNFFWEEKVELGRRRNIFMRMGFAFDRYLVRKATQVIAVTKAAAKIYSVQLGCSDGLAQSVAVVHNSYNPTRFGDDDGARMARRKELRLENKVVTVYAGSLVRWYLFEEMARFCNRLHIKHSDSTTMWCSYEWNQDTERWANGMLEGDVRLLNLAPEEVPGALQASDVGLMFLRLTVSNTTTFPIKFAEYLASGLPVVINRGLESPEEIIRRYKVGVVVEDMTDEGMDRAVDELMELLHDPEIRERAHEAAKKEFHLDQAVEKYRQCYHILAAL
jgi:glycosyltransferase involved in cell wall biosynthesis